MDLLQDSTCDFSVLPEKIFNNIMSYLLVSDAMRASITCKTWYGYSKNRNLWKKKYLDLEQQMFGSEPDVNIWQDSETNMATFTKDHTGALKEASLNTLVAAVTPQAELPDIMDVTTFMVTYQTFTTTKKLVRKLIQRYIVPNLKIGSADEIKTHVTSVARPIQVRVCKLLKPIIETHYLDFDADLIELVKLFVLAFMDQGVLAKQVQGAILTAERIQNTFNLRGGEDSSASHSNIVVAGATPANISNYPKKSSILGGNFFDLSSEEIARQLTLIEFEMYSKIKPSEFFKQAWAKPHLYHHAPHIRGLIEQFNKISKWVTFEIVQEEKIRNRVKRMVKFIKIAMALRIMKNYHTLMAILGGLQDGPVYRLKFTREELPLKAQVVLNELTTLMSANGSYSNYRAELSTAKSPCIPYIGIYLRDLTYYDESGSSEDGMINFKSKKNVYSVIQIIQKYLAELYPFKSNEKAINYLKSLALVDDETLLKNSVLREPKNAKRADVQ